MMSGIKLGKEKSDRVVAGEASRIHRKNELPDDLIRFSLRHFSVNDKFCYPLKNQDSYYPSLLERMKELSNFKVSEFRTNKARSLRCHTHDWSKTSEPEGYAQLSDQLRECEPWQFCLSANEHGRVHGILIDEVFYIIWIDVEHKLYPQ